MKIKFYISPYESPHNAHYQHCIVALAEGLMKIGVQYYGNINYWYCIELKEFLIKKAPKNYNSDLDIYSNSFFKDPNKNPQNISFGKINVLIDSADGLKSFCHSEGFQFFNVILRTHYNSCIQYQTNTIPWAFGLTERMINAIDKYSNKTIRANVILDNSRVHLSLRSYIERKFTSTISSTFQVERIVSQSLDDKLEFDKNYPHYWAQSGRRHDESYFKEVNGAQFFFTFGGIFEWKPYSGIGFHKFLSSKAFGICDKLNVNLLEHFSFIYQYDSWRFWEGLYSNSIPIHVDFQKWGFRLPINPINGTHYIGTLSPSPTDLVKQIRSMTNAKRLEISKAGKEWALKYYSPKPTAERFLDIIRKIERKY